MQAPDTRAWIAKLQAATQKAMKTHAQLEEEHKIRVQEIQSLTANIRARTGWIQFQEAMQLRACAMRQVQQSMQAL